MNIHQSLLLPVDNPVFYSPPFAVPFEVGDLVRIPLDYCLREPIFSVCSKRIPLRVESISVCGRVLRVKSLFEPQIVFFVESSEVKFLG